MVQNRIILINEYVSRGLNENKRKLDSVAASQNNLNNSVNETVKRQKSLFGAMTKARIAFFNIAVIASFTALAFRAIKKPSIELETAMADVRKTTKLSAEEIDSLKGELISLSAVIPISAKELAGIAAVAGQLGINGEKSILTFTRTVGLMTIATELSAEEAAKNLAKIAAAFELPIASVGRIGSVINELSNTTAANATEISKSLLRAGAAASSLGLSFETTAAALSTLISAGIGAERAGTRLRSLFIQMASNADAFSKIASLSLRDYLDLLNTDAQQALQRVLSGLNDNEAGIVNLAEAYDAAGRVAGFALSVLAQQQNELTKNINTANRAWEENISLSLEAGIRAETTASQWQLLKNQIIGITVNSNSMTKSFIEGSRSLIEFSGIMNSFEQVLATTIASALAGGAVGGPIGAGAGAAVGLIFESARVGFMAGKASIKAFEEEYVNLINLLIENDIGQEASQGILDYVDSLEGARQKLDAVRTFTASYNSTNQELISSLKLLNKELEGTKIFDVIAVSITKANLELSNFGKLTPELRDELSLLVTEAQNVVKALKVSPIGEFFDALAEGLDKIQGKGGLTGADFLSGFGELFELSKPDLLTKQLDQALANAELKIAEVIRKNKILKDQGLAEDIVPTISQLLGTTKPIFLEYIEFVRGSEQATNDWATQLKAIKEEINRIKDEIGNAEDLIRTILNRRFTIRGISETNIIGLIERQEIELNKARFATLGLGSAEDFLRNATLVTSDAIDLQTKSIENLTDAASRGQSQFEAWRTALQETIRSLLINSQDIERDITGVIKKAQTELLGITQFGTSNNDQFSVLTDNLDNLRLAQDIFFGEERQKLTQSERLREDRINGVNASAAEAISALDAERSHIIFLEEEIDVLIGKQNDLQAKIDEFSTQNAVDQLEALRKKARDTSSAVNSVVGGGGSGGGGGDLGPAHKTFTTLPTAIQPIIRPGAIRPGAINNDLVGTFNDFISRPGQPAISFSPQDTIVGFKGGSTTAGGSSIGSVTININGANRNSREIATEVRRELMSLA